MKYSSIAQREITKHEKELLVKAQVQLLMRKTDLKSKLAKVEEQIKRIDSGDLELAQKLGTNLIADSSYGAIKASSGHMYAVV